MFFTKEKELSKSKCQNMKIGSQCMPQRFLNKKKKEVIHIYLGGDQRLNYDTLRAFGEDCKLIDAYPDTMLCSPFQLAFLRVITDFIMRKKYSCIIEGSGRWGINIGGTVVECLPQKELTKKGMILFYEERKCIGRIEGIKA